jgi:cellulose synthase/poly-beta-1,6-N-acetylglucosamine synthase-like glycosyltransferase
LPVDNSNEKEIKTLIHPRKNIIAFVLAHNEEDIIRSAIDSILTQTVKVDVVVISDNSTDNTVSIVKSIAATNSRVSLIETVGNKFKKSGALNAAYQNIDLEPYDYVLSVDGDTVLAPDLVEQALIEFQLDPLLGAVCSRAGVVKQITNGFFEKLVYHWQYVEYAEFDRSRISQDRSIKVAHGMCTVYKVEAIKAVMSRRIATGKLDCTLYDVHNITEDYELTVTLKELGYHVAAGFGMYAWTDVPLKLSELWKQRVRWLRGGLDTLWEHGWNKSTRKDILNAGFFWIMLSFQIILLYYALYDIVRGVYLPNWLFLLVMSIMYIDCVYTLRYVQNPSKWDYLIRMTFIPQLFYAWFTIAQLVYAYYLFLFKPNQDW